MEGSYQSGATAVLDHTALAISVRGGVEIAPECSNEEKDSGLEVRMEEDIDWKRFQSVIPGSHV